MSDDPQRRRFSASPSPPREARRIPASGSQGRRFAAPTTPTREARRIRSSIQVVGSSIDVDAGGQTGRLHVLAPNNLEIWVPIEDGKVNVWLTQVGTWTYSWEGSDQVSSVDVVEPKPVEAAPKMPTGRLTSSGS